jgi:hypothetical protein
VIDGFGIRKRGLVQEIRKNPEISDQTFRGYFFFEIVGCIGVEKTFRAIREINPWKVTVVEHFVDVPLLAEFR